MEKFEYLTSLDHAHWFVAADEPGVILNKECIKTAGRLTMKNWINKHCRGKVFGWNKCSSPEKGELDWHKKVMPQGDMIFFFEYTEDRVLFSLTWANDEKKQK
jgi:hypothetical protein